MVGSADSTNSTIAAVAELLRPLEPASSVPPASFSLLCHFSSLSASRPPLYLLSIGALCKVVVLVDFYSSVPFHFFTCSMSNSSWQVQRCEMSCSFNFSWPRPDRARQLVVYCSLEVDRSGRAERGALSDRDADANSTDKAACIQRGQR